MRLLYLFLILIVSTLTTQAQVAEIPATYNPTLVQHAQQKAATRLSKIETFKARHPMPNTATVAARSGNNEANVFLVSGDTVLLFDNTFGDSTNVIDCNPLNFGTLQTDTLGVTYIANTGVELGIDTVCVEVCIPGLSCDTLIYPVVVHRASTSIDYGLVTMNAETSEERCIMDADIANLPGNLVSTSLLPDVVISNPDAACGDYSDFRTAVTLSGNCVLYEASAFRDTDELCIVICDDVNVCDTIRMNFEVTQTAIDLPFFDDFSDSAIYPKRAHWLTDDVYINTTLAHEPPSVGVATFDGLNEDGRPYNTGINLPSDELISAYIDLSSFSNFDNVFLSYYVQAKGNGDGPESIDSLLLEFKTVDGDWISIDAIEGLGNIANDSIPPFQYKSHKVTGFEFFHDAFQFRFVNKSSGTGAVDMWHLDYVLLDNNIPNSIFSDVAFTKQPDNILSRYSSMPWRHFEGHEVESLDKFIEVGIINHDNELKTISTSEIVLTELNNNIEVYNTELFNGEEANIDTGDADNRTYNLDSNNPTVFPNIWSGQNYLNTMQSTFNEADAPFAFELKYEFATGDEITTNDTVRSLTIFDDYFAYDDGSAESNIAARGAGTQIALAYHANVADSLHGIQLYIPHINVDVSTQKINLKVWADSLETEPIYELTEINPVYADTYFDSLQAFATYRFQTIDDDTGEVIFTPLALPVGDFFIGWEQVSDEFDEAMPIGLDKNNPEASAYTFVNTQGSWNPLPSFIQGAIMMRPLVGNTPIIYSTDVEELEITLNNSIKIYPNPSSGLVFFDIKSGDYADYELAVYDTMGRLIQKNALSSELFIENKGLYFINIFNIKTQTLFNAKVFIE